MKVKFVQFTQHPTGRKVSINPLRVDSITESAAPYVIIHVGGANDGVTVREDYTSVVRRIDEAINNGVFH